MYDRYDDEFYSDEFEQLPSPAGRVLGFVSLGCFAAGAVVAIFTIISIYRVSAEVPRPGGEELVRAVRWGFVAITGALAGGVVFVAGAIVGLVGFIIGRSDPGGDSLWPGLGTLLNVLPLLAFLLWLAQWRQ